MGKVDGFSSLPSEHIANRGQKVSHEERRTCGYGKRITLCARTSVLASSANCGPHFLGSRLPRPITTSYISKPRSVVLATCSLLLHPLLPCVEPKQGLHVEIGLRQGSE